MRMRIFLLMIIVAWIGAAASAMPRFSQKPRVSVSEGRVKIEFAVEAPTDATVEILDAEGKIVRHIAAGMLGPKAPAPFKPGLKQTLHWDRKDDSGNPVQSPCRVRVGLGLKAELDRILGWGNPLCGEIKAMAVDASGLLHVLHVGIRRRKERSQAFISTFDRKGMYLGSILPYDPDLEGEEAHGLSILTLKDVGKVPAFVFRRLTQSNSEIYPRRYRYKGKMYPEAYAADQTAAVLPSEGLLMVRKTPDGGKQVIRLASDGTVSCGPRLPGNETGVCHLAVAADGTGFFLADAEGKLYRGALNDRKLKPLDMKKPVSSAAGLASDSAGRIYIADRTENSVVVLTSAGRRIRSLPVPEPGAVDTGPAGKAVYVLSRGVEILKLASDGNVIARLSVPEAGKLLAVDTGAERPVLWMVSKNGDAVVRIVDRGSKLVMAGPIREAGPMMGRITRIAAHSKKDEIFIKHYRRRAYPIKLYKDGNILRMDGRTGGMTQLNVYCHEMACGPQGNLYVMGNIGHNWAYIAKYDREGKPIPIREDKNWFKFEGQVSRGCGESNRGIAVAPNGDIYVLYPDVYDSTKGYGPQIGDFETYGDPGPPRKRRPFTTTGPSWLDIFGPDGSTKKKHVLAFTQGAAGIGVDRNGNIYVADAIKPAGRIYPEAYDSAGELPRSKPDLSSDAPEMAGAPWGWDGVPNWYYIQTGTLFKFGPEGGAITWKHGIKSAAPPDFEGPVRYWRHREMRAGPVKIKGEKWAYFGVSPVPQGTSHSFWFPKELYRKAGSTTHMTPCVCHGARWELDGHGRIVVPDAMRYTVVVLDPAGNVLLEFGGFTMLAAEGHGSPAPQPAPPGISFGYAPYLAVNDHGVYIADVGNRRIVKVKLTHSVEQSVPVP